MDQPGCLRCGSDKVIRGARMNDRGEGNAKAELQVRIGFEHPNALLFKSPIEAEVRADICGECGWVELRVADPQALWAAFTAMPSQPRP